jgi:hypothetical protein
MVQSTKHRVSVWYWCLRVRWNEGDVDARRQTRDSPDRLENVYPGTDPAVPSRTPARFLSLTPGPRDDGAFFFPE